MSYSAEKKRSAKDDAALLKEVRDRFSYATAEWKDIRDEAKKDMRYVAGDPWEPAEREKRRQAGRPCLSLDELGQYFNQPINDVRANPRGVKFTANGNGANDQSALFYADKMREIEYRSKAQIAYTTAFQDAVHRSYGFCRVNTRYQPRSFNQDIWIEPLVNPDLVTPDPDALMPSGSDMKYCFIHESRTVDEFKAEFPDREIQDFSLEHERVAFDWVKSGRVQVAEYWKVKTRKRKLLLLKPTTTAPPTGTLNLRAPVTSQEPQQVFEDELPKDYDKRNILKERTVDDQSVCQYVTNGIEILSTTEWPGKYIPIACCFGIVLYLDQGSGSKRTILSMTRLARDPYMLYCYYRTCEAELVGMTPKFPYFAYEGQLSEAEEQNIAKSLHEPVALIKVKPVMDVTGQNVLPFPQRQPYEPPIAALEAGAEAARRGIQAAMGVSPLPTQALRRNEKSGIALKQIETTQQKGSFHFADHYNGMQEHIGVMVEDLMDKIHDVAADLTVRKPNDTSETVRVNDPNDPKAVSTKGDHLVTVSTGPSFDSQRETQTDFVTNFIANPELMQMVGPHAGPKVIARGIKLLNMGEGGDEIADIISPPEPKDGQPPTAEQLMQTLQEGKAKFDQLAQAAQQMQQELATDQVKMQAQKDMKQAELESRERIAMEDRAAKIEIARITAAKQSADLEREAQEEALALAETQLHDARQAEEGRAHDVAMETMKQAHALQAGQIAHDQAMQAGAAGHAQKLEQGDAATQGKLAIQAAAPQPEAGAGA